MIEDVNDGDRVGYGMVWCVVVSVSGGSGGREGCGKVW